MIDNIKKSPLTKSKEQIIDEIAQIYFEIFCALKIDMKKDVRIDFNQKLVSGILQNDEEKKACFYWLLDQLHDKDNIHGIKN